MTASCFLMKTVALSPAPTGFLEAGGHRRRAGRPRHEFVLRLPDGYDSLVGERGQFLSGGERQRISIARALLIDPRILILDEATSSVNTETEREIQLALENLVQGRTTIAIAHRLSTLRRADRLVVVERGQITEVGPHDELLKRGGTYARLHRGSVRDESGDWGLGIGGFRDLGIWRFGDFEIATGQCR